MSMTLAPYLRTGPMQTVAVADAELVALDLESEALDRELIAAEELREAARLRKSARLWRDAAADVRGVG